MDKKELWSAFLETGAPEIYLLFNRARRMEEANVFNDSGTCASGNGVQ